MDVHVPSRTLIVPGLSASATAIQAVLPHVSKLLSDGRVAVRHNIETTRVLRNMGYEVPSPIMAYYDWPGPKKPFQHQFAMAEFATLHRRFFNLGDMGIGKTKATLWAADWLLREGRIRKILVLAPLSSLEKTWMQEIFDTITSRRAVVVHGDRKKRLKMLAMDVDFYILNHEGIALRWVTEALPPDIDLVVVDEGGEFRNPSTDKYKALRAYLRPQQRLWWLTGTPCPNLPSDVWSQCQLVDPRTVPAAFGKFKVMTCHAHPIGQGRITWSPAPSGYRVAWEAMQPAIRFAKDDCLDLPPVVTEDWMAPLSAEQRATFERMRKEMYAEDLQRKARGGVISAVNAADRLNKLRQILCGSVRRPDGSYMRIDCAPRLKVLREAIECAAAKVLVIVPFKGIIRDLEQELTHGAAGPRYTVGLLNGDVGIGARNRIISDFKTKASPHLLLCHPDVMSHSLSLVEADVLIFFAPIYSNNRYRQVIERFNRPGQTHKMTIVRMGAHKLEWKIYALVDKRDDAQASVLRLYQETVSHELQ